MKYSKKTTIQWYIGEKIMEQKRGTDTEYIYRYFFVKFEKRGMDTESTGYRYFFVKFEKENLGNRSSYS